METATKQGLSLSRPADDCFSLALAMVNDRRFATTTRGVLTGPANPPQKWRSNTLGRKKLLRRHQAQSRPRGSVS